LWRPQVGLAGSRGGVHVHFALKIEERDYEEAAAALRERGLEVEEVCFEDGAGRAAFVTDPDGHVVEFWTWDVAGHLAAAPIGNIELAQRAIEAYNRRDVEAACSVCHPDVEWWTVFVGQLEGRPYSGHAGIRDYFAEFGQTWDDIHFEGDDYRDLGDAAVYIGRIYGRGHESGVALDSPFGVVFDIRDGLIWRIRSYLDPTRALAEAGLGRSANVALIEQIMEAHARRDWDEVFARYHPDIEWDESDNAILDLQRVCHGHDEVRQWLRDLNAAWEFVEYEQEGLIPAGEDVVQLLRAHVRGRSSGVEMAGERYAQVWTIRDGLVVRLRYFQDRDEALRAVGLEHAAGA
jgi:ketosteroid isomerase-like protein